MLKASASGGCCVPIALPGTVVLLAGPGQEPSPHTAPQQVPGAPPCPCPQDPGARPSAELPPPQHLQNPDGDPEAAEARGNPNGRTSKASLLPPARGPGGAPRAIMGGTATGHWGHSHSAPPLAHGAPGGCRGWPSRPSTPSAAQPTPPRRSHRPGTELPARQPAGADKAPQNPALRELPPRAEPLVPGGGPGCRHQAARWVGAAQDQRVANTY